jgi:cell division septation protein DedD
MRDFDRLQDVVEYHVSPSQLRLLILGVLAVTCAIFAVGVSVGKRLEPGSSAMAVDPLSGLDEAAIPLVGAGDQEEAEPPALTYHNELTQPEISDRPAHVEDEEEEQQQRAPGARRAPGDVSSPRSGRAEVAARGVAEADEPLPSEPAQPDQPQPGESSVFTLQVGSFDTREEASQFASTLRGRGHPTFIIRTSMPTRGTWFRVRVGPFRSRREATSYQSRFERMERLPTFLVQRRTS